MSSLSLPGTNTDAASTGQLQAPTAIDERAPAIALEAAEASAKLGFALRTLSECGPADVRMFRFLGDLALRRADELTSLMGALREYVP